MRNIVEWSQRPRRKERIAGSLKDARLPFIHFREAFDQRGFLDASFTADDHHSAVAVSDIAENSFQFTKKLFALEQVHFFLRVGSTKPGFRFAAGAILHPARHTLVSPSPRGKSSPSIPAPWATEFGAWYRSGRSPHASCATIGPIFNSVPGPLSRAILEPPRT